MSKKDLSEVDFEVGPGSQVVVEYLDAADLIARRLGILVSDIVYLANWCKLHGIKYTKNLLLLTGKSDDMLPVFQQIIYVIVSENNSAHFLTLKWKTTEYHRHTHSYAIELPNDPKCSIISLNNLCNYCPYHASESYDEEDLLSHVVLRHRIL